MFDCILSQGFLSQELLSTVDASRMRLSVHAHFTRALGLVVAVPFSAHSHPWYWEKAGKACDWLL